MFKALFWVSWALNRTGVILECPLYQLYLIITGTTAKDTNGVLGVRGNKGYVANMSRMIGACS